MSIFDIAKRLYRNKRLDQLTLPQLVTLLADEPTIENRNAFYRSMLTSKVGARISNADGSIQPGTQMTTEDDRLEIPTATGPDGTPMLLVYCDIPGMFAAHPNDTFFELDGRVVLEMAQSIGGGIIVQNGTDGKDSWAGIPKDHVVSILTGKYI